MYKMQWTSGSCDIINDLFKAVKLLICGTVTAACVVSEPCIVFF